MAFSDLIVGNIEFSGLITVVILIVIGVIVGMIAKFLVKKISGLIIYPWIRKSLPSSYKGTVSGVNLTASIIQWVIVLLFIFQALSVFQIFLLQEIIRVSIIFLPKLAVASIIIVIGLIISGIISKKINDLDFKSSKVLSKIFNIVFISAIILSALEVIGIMLTPFLYIFAAGLLGIALAFAIAFGIAFGLALKPEISRLINEFKKKYK